MSAVAKQFEGGLQIQGRERTLTKGQKALLSTIEKCIQFKKPLDWDLIVLVYTENVRSQYRKDLDYNFETRRYQTYVMKDILPEYQKLTPEWTYGLRINVRQWFLTNLSVLILKNKLIVVPIMSIE